MNIELIIILLMTIITMIIIFWRADVSNLENRIKSLQAEIAELDRLIEEYNKHNSKIKPASNVTTITCLQCGAKSKLI